MKIIVKNYSVIFLFSLIVTLLMMIWLPLSAVADETLPRRYPPTRVGHEGKGHGRPVGAYIELHPHSSQATLWTIVQWQDDLGGWHDVEGWKGTLDEGYKKVWWVAVADFNKGPFRWVIYQGQGGKLLAISEPFDLPNMPNQTTSVEVWLAQ